MVGSSKKRKSSLRGSSPQPRQRRVCFDVPSVGESTTHLDGPPEAPVLQPAIGVPPAAPYPYGGDDAPWNQNSPCYGPTCGSMPSSTATLFGSGLSTMTGPFVEQTMTAHGSYWVNPVPHGSRWSQTIQPLFQPEVVLEVSADDDGDARVATATLRNICVASTAAAILAVVIVVALVAESSVPKIDTGTSEMSHVVDRLHSGNIGIAAPRLPIKLPQATRKSVAMAPTTSAPRPRRVTSRQRVLPAAPKRATSTTTRRLTVGMTSASRPSGNRTLPHQCSSHFYTYCTTAPREFYYSASSHACLSTEVDSVHLCNHGSNRFPNLGSCLASCVHAGHPRDRCYENVLFGACTRQGVAETWWYYNGSACSKWDFSLGNCPSLGRSVYRHRRECDKMCLPRQERGNTTAGRHPRCKPPAAVRCTPQQLKYPYFADMRARGSARCVKASSHTLRHRRCLIGSNRFDSIASCEKSCVHL